MGLSLLLELVDFREQTVFALLIVLASWAAIHAVARVLARSKRVDAPRVGRDPGLWGLRRARADFAKNGKALTEEGYAKYKDSMYWIQTGDMERLVVSNRFIDELRKLPDTHLDSRTAVVERNLGWYNGIDIILKSTTHVDVCRTKLVQNLDSITEGQVEELDHIFRLVLGACFKDNDVHFFDAHETILNIVNRAVAKTLVGRSLSRNDDWLQTSLDTTVNTGLLCRQLQPYPALLRPIVCRFSTLRQKLDRNLKTAEGMLSPLISGRQRDDENKDILQWLMDLYEEDLNQGIPFLTQQILSLATASTRSTAIAIVHVLFDLLSRPQHLTTLQDEIEKSVAEAGGWNLPAVQSMKRLDSFIKESQRMNHHILFNFNRKVCKPTTLSNGVVIPPGTFLCTSGYWAARDPELLPHADEFRPWRWFELREEAERQGRPPTPYLASSTSSENLHWGYGRNACPGRFMAAAELKLLLAWTLFHFDVAFPEGQADRPENLFVDERVHPRPGQKIGLRLRKDWRVAAEKA